MELENQMSFPDLVLRMYCRAWYWLIGRNHDRRVIEAGHFQAGTRSLFHSACLGTRWYRTNTARRPRSFILAVERKSRTGSIRFPCSESSLRRAIALDPHS